MSGEGNTEVPRASGSFGCLPPIGSGMSEAEDVLTKEGSFWLTVLKKKKKVRLIALSCLYAK